MGEIIELFSSLGYDCETDAMMSGLSRSNHHFDILARKGSEILVMNIFAFRRSLLDTIASDEESDEQILRAAVRMRVMAWDCRAYHSIILHLSSAVPGPREDAEVKEILKEMKINLMTSSDIHGVVPKLKELLFAKEEVA